MHFLELPKPIYDPTKPIRRKTFNTLAFKTKQMGEGHHWCVIAENTEHTLFRQEMWWQSAYRELP